MKQDDILATVGMSTAEDFAELKQAGRRWIEALDAVPSNRPFTIEMAEAQGKAYSRRSDLEAVFRRILGKS